MLGEALPNAKGTANVGLKRGSAPAREKPRSGSRRNANRQQTKEGVVKAKPSQPSGSRSGGGRSRRTLFKQQREIARQHCVELVGASEMHNMMVAVGTNGAERLYAWRGIEEILRRDFGDKYAHPKQLLSLAEGVLHAHRQHLGDIERQKERARAASTAQTIRGPKPAFNNKVVGRKPRTDHRMGRAA